MTYAELLENSYLDDFNACVSSNDTFASISEYMTENFNFLLTESSEFDIKFGITDLIFEATEDEETGEEKKKFNLGATMKRAGSAIVTALKNLWEKLVEFLKKIPEAIKRVFAKISNSISLKNANSTVNKLKNIVSKYPDAILDNELNITYLALDNIATINSRITGACEAVTNMPVPGVTESGKSERTYETIMMTLSKNKDIIDLGSKPFDGGENEGTNAKGNITKTIHFNSGKLVSEVYKFLDFEKQAKELEKSVTKMSETFKKAISKLNECKKEIEKARKAFEKAYNTTDTENRNAVKLLIDLTNLLMKSFTSYLTFSTNWAKVITANANRVSSAAVSNGKKVAAAAKKAEKESK